MRDTVNRMADARKKRAAEIQDAIRRILFRHWDPIGVNDDPRLGGEYDNYIGGVYRLLSNSPSEDDLIDYLISIKTDAMGLETPPRDSLRSIARRLLVLDIRLRG